MKVIAEEQYNISTTDFEYALHISPSFNYRKEIQYGDIVCFKGEYTDTVGYVADLDDSKAKVVWLAGVSEWEPQQDLLVLPLQLGLEFLDFTVSNYKCESFALEWVRVINGLVLNKDKAEKEIKIGDMVYFSVPFLTYDKVTDSVTDTKFKRTVKLYKELDQFVIYKAPLFPQNGYQDYNNAFYLREKDGMTLYYLGIGKEIRTILSGLASNSK